MPTIAAATTIAFGVYYYQQRRRLKMDQMALKCEDCEKKTPVENEVSY